MSDDAKSKERDDDAQTAPEQDEASEAEADAGADAIAGDDAPEDGGGDDAPEDGGGDDAPEDGGGDDTPVSHVSAAEAAEEAFFSEDAELYEGEEVDPELLKIPRRRKRRHPIISIAVIAASLYLMWFSRADLLYYFEPAKPRVLGAAAKALAAKKLVPNRFVSVTGPPDRKHALVLERRVSGYDTFYRLLGVNSRVFVQAHRKTRTTRREVDYQHFGRVVRFWSLSYAKALAKYLERRITRAYDINFSELARAKAAAGKGAAARITDRRGRKALVKKDQALWVNASYPQEWIVRLSRRAYKTLAEARKQLDVIKIPFAVDSEPSRQYWRLAVLLDAEQVKTLRKRFRTPELYASLQRREVAYMVKWDQVSVEGDAVVLRAADPSFAPRYEKRGDKVAGVKPKGEVRVPKAAVRYITLGARFVVPRDAVVLVSGETPKSYWYYLVLYLVLGAFIAFNGLALYSRFKKDEAPKKAAA